MFRSQQIHIAVWFFDELVEERSLPKGRSAAVGRDQTLALPLPKGHDWVAKVSWTGPHTARVRDYQGHVYELTAKQPETVVLGPIRVVFTLQDAFTLRRVWDTGGLVGALVGTFLLHLGMTAVSLIVATGPALHTTYCNTWLYPAYPQIHRRFWTCENHAASDPANGGGRFSADFLERMLRKDYQGARDEGAISLTVHKQSDRPTVYLPAGQLGPLTEQGGAARTALRPQRQPAESTDKAKGSKAIAAKASKSQVKQPENHQGQDGTADQTPNRAKPNLPAAEEKTGWGLSDWYDQEDLAYESKEIQTMKRLAERVLAINPDDPDALVVLSTYQYLSEDYDAALKTYDRMMTLFPEDPAVYNNKALIYKRRKQYDKEEFLYRVALNLDPKDATALNNLAVNLSHQGHNAEALQIMKDLEVTDPNNPYTDLHRAKIYAIMGQTDLALQYLKQALAGMKRLNTLHHIEFRQDIRVDPAFSELRKTSAFHRLLATYYGEDTPLPTQE